ncbi:MAG: SIS domain-containing protein [Candidatus Ratteibacteria bacterium]|jgi:D-sedoheptulose 7-phosphate isomerase
MGNVKVCDWPVQVKQLCNLLLSVSFRDKSGREISSGRGFLEWQRLTRELRKKKRTIYLIGNGASASMASHFAADLAKNAQLHTEVFSDLSLITAISNDKGYKHVFAEPLRRRGCSGDMLLAISSSGRSPNVLTAVDVANRLGLTVVTLSGMNRLNPLRRKGRLNVYVEAAAYGEVETCHAAVLHHWMDLVQYGTGVKAKNF